MTTTNNPLADALDRLHTQVMVKFHEARQRDAQPYWEDRVDALDWVLQRIDDIKATFPAEWKP